MNGVEVVASWFTPTVLFCVLNLMIGTIFITSTLKPPPTHHQNKEEQPPQHVRVPSLFERVKSFNISRHQSSQPDPVHHANVPAQEEPHRHEAEEEPHRHEAKEESHHVTRSKSDTVAKAAPAARKLQKSASVKVSTEKEVEEDEERRRPATVRERTAAEDEEVDEKADDFINRFRQQLKLQRLDSLLRYRAAGR